MNEYMPNEENEELEYKETTGEIREGVSSLVAMLNKSKKGNLYFGVKNNRKIIGQQMGVNTVRDVTRAISENIEPKIYAKVNQIKLHNKDCIFVEVEGEDIPYFSYGKAYMRVGDEDRTLSQKEIKKLILQTEEKNNRWERKISEYTIDDIDEDILKKFIEKGNKKGRISFEYTNKQDILKKLELLNNNNLINAGYVLFGKEARLELKMAVFATDEKTTFIDMQSKFGNIFNLIEIGEKYIKENIRWSANFNTGSFSRMDISEVPITAMREIIINSLIHRNMKEPYSNDIAIYKNRIEISNTGFFTDEATPEDYINSIEKSRPVNPLIAYIVYLTGEIEKWGSGIKKIYNECKQESIKVDFKNRKTGFFVTVYRKNMKGLIENTEKDLTKVQDKVQDKVRTK